MGIFPGSMEPSSPVYGRKSRKKVLFKGREDKNRKKTRVQGSGQGGTMTTRMATRELA